MIELSDCAFTPASPDDQKSGLLGWITAKLNGRLVLDGLTLRRTLEGRLCLSFPTRKDRAGREHAYLRPVDNDAREELERQIFQALRTRAPGLE